MRKLSFLALVLAMCLCLGACSSGEAPSVPEEPTTAVPEYSFINSDRYVQNGTTGIGYRVAIGDGATEEEMRAVFWELCSADSYDLHTVWFYGLPERRRGRRLVFRRYARGKISRCGACLYALHL